MCLVFASKAEFFAKFRALKLSSFKHIGLEVFTTISINSCLSHTDSCVAKLNATYSASAFSRGESNNVLLRTQPTNSCSSINKQIARNRLPIVNFRSPICIVISNGQTLITNTLPGSLSIVEHKSIGHCPLIVS